MKTTITPQQSLLLVLLVLLLMLGTAPLVTHLGIWGIALTQLLLIATPSLGLARGTAKSWRQALATLGFQRPSSSALLGSLLVGSTFWYLNFAIVWPFVEHFLDGTKAVKHIAQATSHPSILTTLVIVGVLPAVCEELLMRGIVTNSLDAKTNRLTAIAASALLFGLLHSSPARMVPTTLLGLILGFAFLSTKSIWPPILIHLFNNAFVLVLSSQTFPQISEFIIRHPWWVGEEPRLQRSWAYSSYDPVGAAIQQLLRNSNYILEKTCDA